MTIKKAKLSLGGKVVEYDSNNPEEKKKAFMEVFNMTSEAYDAQQGRVKKHDEEYESKYPALKNLVWSNTQMYYVDLAGKRTTQKVNIQEVTEQMLEELKEVNPDDTILVNGVPQSRSELLKKDLAKVKI